MKLRDERTDLIRALHVAGEQDEAARALIGEERPLLGRQRFAGASGDEGFEGHIRGLALPHTPVKARDAYCAATKQSVPWDFRSPQSL
jgi:hypothetical protein